MLESYLKPFLRIQKTFIPSTLCYYAVFKLARPLQNRLFTSTGGAQSTAAYMNKQSVGDYLNCHSNRRLLYDAKPPLRDILRKAFMGEISVNLSDL